MQIEVSSNLVTKENSLHLRHQKDQRNWKMLVARKWNVDEATKKRVQDHMSNQNMLRSLIAAQAKFLGKLSHLPSEIFDHHQMWQPNENSKASQNGFTWSYWWLHVPGSWMEIWTHSTHSRSVPWIHSDVEKAHCTSTSWKTPKLWKVTFLWLIRSCAPVRNYSAIQRLWNIWVGATTRITQHKVKTPSGPKYRVSDQD